MQYEPFQLSTRPQFKRPHLRVVRQPAVDPFEQIRARWAEEERRKQRLARLTGVGACAVSAATVLYFALQLARAL